jgi:DNA/RNA endonuclease YhcR with UshA esterase domain
MTLPPSNTRSNTRSTTVFSRVHVYDNNNNAPIQNDWGRDPLFWATAKVFVSEILNSRAVENTNDTVWEIEDRRVGGGGGEGEDLAAAAAAAVVNKEKKIRRIRKCELCGVIVEFTTRKDSKIFLTLDDGTGVIECVIWAPSTMTSKATSEAIVDDHSSLVVNEEEENYNLNQVERDPFGRIVADDGVLLLHGKLRLGETVFVQGRVSLYNGEKQIVVNSMQMICEKEGLARERDLESLFWLDVVEQRMDKGY